MSRKEKKPVKIKKFTRKMQKKLASLFLFVVLVLVGLNIRITYINAEKGEQYTKQVLDQQTYDSRTIPYKRGDILDANGTKLATSEKVFNLILDAKVMKSGEKYRETTLNAVNECFELEEDEIKVINDTLDEKPDSRYTIIKKGLTYESGLEYKKKQEEDANINGIWLEEDYVRKYQYDTLASSVIGFLTNEGEGEWGLEKYYESQLSGTNGREFGYWTDEAEMERTTKSSTDGNSLITNIDVTLQSIAQKHIDAYMENNANKYRDGAGAENIGVVMMDPNTGAVLTMADSNNFNLNKPRDLKEYYSQKEIDKMNDEERVKALSEIWKNYCISTPFEPGSTMKTITYAAGFESGKLTGNEGFSCGGNREVGGFTINCVLRSGHGHLTLEEGLMKSCNVVLMGIGDKLGAKTFSKYQSIFNIGKFTGIDLPGEVVGAFYSGENMTKTDLATNTFGQNYETNMMQVAAAFASIINGGDYYQPQVAKQVVNSDGAVVENIEPVLLKQTVSKSTSDIMKKYLLNTVENGTADPAQIKGYEIGGKTGTAQVLPRGTGDYVVSFIGYVGQDNPELLIYVVIDRPNEKDQPHSSYATELTHDILEEAISYLNIYPASADDVKEDDKKDSKSSDQVDESGSDDSYPDTIPEDAQRQEEE